MYLLSVNIVLDDGSDSMVIASKWSWTGHAEIPCRISAGKIIEFEPTEPHPIDQMENAKRNGRKSYFYIYILCFIRQSARNSISVKEENYIEQTINKFFVWVFSTSISNELQSIMIIMKVILRPLQLTKQLNMHNYAIHIHSIGTKWIEWKGPKCMYLLCSRFDEATEKKRVDSICLCGVATTVRVEQVQVWMHREYFTVC